MFHPVANDPFITHLLDRVLPEGLDDVMLKTCLCFVNANNGNNTTTTTGTILSTPPHLPLQPVLQNTTPSTTLTRPCIPTDPHSLLYLPWNNPDHFASADIESSSRHVKDLVMAFLFLIGLPASVINMAVFYKQSLEDRVNLCLFALSLADGLYLISAILVHGEQVLLQFTSKDRYGAVVTFVANHNLIGFTGFCFVSFALSAIIASEKCRCVLSPLKFQAQLRIRTMTVIICAVYILVLGLYFLVAFRYRVGCVFDPVTGAVFKTGVNGKFYQSNRQLIDYLDSFVFGGAIPVAVIVVVMISTVITIVKLHQAVTWRAETTCSLSAREVALTKMLVSNSVLFIICVAPPCLTRFICLFMPEMTMAGGSQNFFLTSLWITEVLSYVNASFNFFVYFTMGSRFRETFWTLFLGRRRRRRRKYSENSKMSATL